MQAAFFRWFGNILDFATSNHPERPIVKAPELDMLQLIQQARDEWASAESYFNCVAEPELVDHAIALKEAAEKRYMYLVKLAKAEGLRAFVPQELTVDSDDESTAMTEPASAASCE